MNDEGLKQIIESKLSQKLREHINEGKDLNEFTESKEVLDKYQSMSESEKLAFMNKGWKND